MSIEGIQGDSQAPIEAQTTEPQVQEQTEPSLEQQPEVTQAKTLDDKLSSKFAALSRKEKMIKQREAQVSQQQKQFEQQLAEIKAENERLKKEFDSYRTGMKQSPLKKLREEGLTFEQLTEMQLNDENPTPEMLIKRTREELETGYKSELEALKRQLAEEKQKAEKDAEERVVTSYKKQINDHISANTDKYELISLNEAHGLVFDVVEEYYQNEGKILSVDEAADYVEKYLEDEARKVLQAKKFAAKGPQPTKPSEKPASLTLSNELSAENPAPSSKKLTREEQLEEASKFLRWES